MAGDLRRWRVHTLTDHPPFSFQVRLFITGNKQGAVRGFEIQGELGEKDCSILVLDSYLFPETGGILFLPGTQWSGCLHLFPGGVLQQCPRGSAIFLGTRMGLIYL